MGSDKARLLLDGETFLALALRNVSSVCRTPVIVGDASRYRAFGTVVEDEFRNCGPLAGIHAALRSSRSEWNLVLSVDLPLMEPAFLSWIAEGAVRGIDSVVVPHVAGQVEPLCAVYRREILPTVEDALKAGRYKIELLFGEVPTRFVTETEIESAGFDCEMFRNVNTPEDYQRVSTHSSSVRSGRTQG